MIGSVLGVVKRQRVQSFNLKRKGKTSWYSTSINATKWSTKKYLFCLHGQEAWVGMGRIVGTRLGYYKVKLCELKSILVALALDESFFCMS